MTSVLRNSKLEPTAVITHFSVHETRKFDVCHFSVNNKARRCLSLLSQQSQRMCAQLLLLPMSINKCKLSTMLLPYFMPACITLCCRKHCMSHKCARVAAASVGAISHPDVQVACEPAELSHLHASTAKLAACLTAPSNSSGRPHQHLGPRKLFPLWRRPSREALAWRTKLGPQKLSLCWCPPP